MKTTIFAIALAGLGLSPLAAKDKPMQMATRGAQPVAVKPVGTPQLPPPEAMIVLIRSSIVALSHANLTNNYAV